MTLDGKTALVTGGGRGIGRAIALAYAQEGADVAVVARTSTEIEEVAAEIRALGRKGVALIADLTISQDVQEIFQAAVEGLGKVDVLVNNAGGYRLYTSNLAHQVPVLEITEEEWRRVLDANLTTAFLCCKAALPHMMERRSGAIINMSSGVATKGRAGGAAYSAAKSAVERLSESLADEVREFGIAVNTLTPGWVLTRPNDDYDAEVHKRMRLPEDIAPSALFLASQTSESLTGQLINAPEFDQDNGIQRPSAYDRLYG
ncbi:MAG: SDR family NAD(P)-dependent oxidoreductase [SAR202 cluster bacterium]|jgi:3-oxoacyl-[acyl-carrier protein] reductase|nr:SDR family NAD(P)-dependent oxidoreductase [SAR202 cluster bacterium]MDP6713541.1 SDR family NAD(P)-dependent oxidoreductase [SAR202 cluster bacterium]